MWVGESWTGYKLVICHWNGRKLSIDVRWLEKSLVIEEVVVMGILVNVNIDRMSLNERSHED